MLRSLIHYWRIHLAVILGAAVATSVLTGALLVGDSVQGSLRQLTLGRLGKVDHAIVSAQHVREALSDELMGSDKGVEIAAPILSIRATVQMADSGVRANKVTLFGVDDRFGRFFEGAPVDSGGARLRLLHANGPLMQTLGAAEGASIILTVEAPSSIHREFLFGHEDAGERVIRQRLRLGRVAGDETGGRFSLEPSQSIPMIAFVRLEALQRLLSLEGRVNGILVSAPGRTSSELAETLASTIQLADYGLALRDVGPHVSLETDRFLLPEHVAESARTLADDRGMAAVGVFTYLANTLATQDASIAYSTVSAVGTWSRRKFPDLFRSVTGETMAEPAPGTVLLNAIAAKRLYARVSDSLTVRFYEVDSDSAFEESDVRFQVQDMIQMDGFAADRSLTPDFPGLHDADNMADWDAPFPVDLGRVTDADEAYWDAHGATPRAFIALEDGQRLWSSRFGVLSSVRFHVPPGVRRDFFRAGLLSGLRRHLSPESQGVRVVPLREAGLTASRGATDFSGLFFGFSMFLVVSGLAMIVQLFKLGIFDRRGEIGLLKALGYETARVRNRWLAEGLILGLLGTAIGVGGGVAYARLMIVGLSTWWVEAVGTRLLQYAGQTSTMIVGGLGSLLLILMVVWRCVRETTRAEAIQLMKGSDQSASPARSDRVRRVSVWAAVVASLCLIASVFLEPGQRVGLFFATGGCMLVSLLGGIRGFADRKVRRSPEGGWAIAQIVRFPGRAMASISLIALATFVLVAVGLNRHGDEAVGHRGSGTGGFRWFGETTSSLDNVFTDPASLVDVGFSSEEARRVSDWDTHVFRLRDGEDISCLNLHRPGQPRILGVTTHTIGRGGFVFHSVAEGVDPGNPWKGLQSDLGEDVIPAIGDFNSVQWILHSGLGKDVVVQDEFGKPVRLRFVALLKGSVLQSEVLISEQHFERHFPSISGYRFFAFDPGPDEAPVESVLETRLSAFGMDVESGSLRLARYRAVENTYMATFQLIGGLGAILGTFGVGVLMMRNAAERRGELAALRAIGFSRRRLRSLLFGETAVLILAGVGIGALSGAVAVATNVITRAGSIPWADVLLSVAGVGVAGCLSGLLTAIVAMRAPIVETLKTER